MKRADGTGACVHRERDPERLCSCTDDIHLVVIHHEQLHRMAGLENAGLMRASVQRNAIAFVDRGIRGVLGHRYSPCYRLFLDVRARDAVRSLQISNAFRLRIKSHLPPSNSTTCGWDDLHPEVKTRLETNRIAAIQSDHTDRWVCSPDAVLHENAACYTSDAFGKVVMRLTGKLAVSSSQYPHLAARGERFWSTLQRHGVQTCQETISTSFLDKRSYDSEKHAHLTQQDLLDDLLRLLVWCYHNTRNAALDGETPLQRWNSLAAANNGIAPPPSRAKYRDLFGLEFTRKAGASGITILNVDYQSSQLTDLWSLDPDHEFELRVDDQDISVISYRDPHSGCWCDAASSQPGLENVSLAEWMATVRFVMSRCDPFEESEMKAEVSKALNDARTGRPNQML